MAETGFSEDAKYYSAISSDGRLKIWDTETSVLKQEYTPDLHLAAPPSCLQWITVAQTVGQTQKQRKEKGTVSETESHCIALGTANGNILIYSVAQAKIQAVLKKGSNKVNALDWHRKYGLYSCAKDNVVEWELQSGIVKNIYNVGVHNKTKEGNIISAIKIVPYNLESKAHYLVTASWQVRLWRLHNKEATVIKTLGHNASQTAVLSVATLNDSCWLIEGSQNERLLSFWDITITEEHLPQVNGDEVTPSKRKRKKSLSNVPTVINASYNFVLEDAPRIVDVELKKEDGATRLSLAAATRSGVVHYYGHMLNGSSIKPLKPSVTLQVTTPEAAPLPLKCCRLRGPDSLLLGYSQPPAMLFETVVPDLKTKTQVLIRGETKTPKRSKQTNETNKVRSDYKSADAQIVEPLGGVSMRKRAAPGAQIEVPMEARLANLSLDLKSRSKSAVNQNLTKLLVQGLHSKDKSIIEMVLLTNEPAVASRTVGNLPAEYIPLLLDQLLLLATQKTQTCASVCTWLHAVTMRHSALLLALMSSSQAEQLTKLLAVFTHRRSHLCQLMNLKGRVELTIKQRTAAEEAPDDQKAMLEYNDDTSSEEEMEVERNKEESEQSWSDEKFDSDHDDDDEMDQDSGDQGSGDDD